MLPTIQTGNNTFKWSIKSIYKSLQVLWMSHSIHTGNEIQKDLGKASEIEKSHIKKHIYEPNKLHLWPEDRWRYAQVSSFSKFQRNGSCVLEKFTFDHLLCVTIFSVGATIKNIRTGKIPPCTPCISPCGDVLALRFLGTRVKEVREAPQLQGQKLKTS